MTELSGGIRNAVEKGESIEKIKQSFINAGYSEQEVSEAVSETNQGYNLISKERNQELNENKNPSGRIKSKAVIFIMVLFFILIGASLIGLYWFYLR